MSADSQTPPGVAIGEVAALLRTVADLALNRDGVPCNWTPAARNSVNDRMHAAASTLDRVAGVLDEPSPEMLRAAEVAVISALVTGQASGNPASAPELAHIAVRAALRTALSPTSGGGTDG